MAFLNFMVYFSMFVMVSFLIFMGYAMRRKNRNEPIFGWQRKQFLEEQNTTVDPQNLKSKQTIKKENKERRKQESILELMELKDIGLGVIERKRNEYLLIIETDFVNFDLLQPGERLSILEGYQQLYNSVNFPVQMLVQAVRQDFSKDRLRFEQNMANCNEHVQRFNQSVIEHIESVTENDFRITMNVFYIVKYHYEPSKLGKLTKEQRLSHIRNNISMRADIVSGALRRARVEGRKLNTLEAAEVLKRALNRDRMLLHPIEDIQEHEKLSDFVTLDYSTLPEFENLVNDVEEALQLVNS